MIDSGIKDITEGGEDVLMKLFSQFMPEMTDQEAERKLLKLIDESVRALFPNIMEKFHEWAQYWKK